MEDFGPLRKRYDFGCCQTKLKTTILTTLCAVPGESEKFMRLAGRGIKGKTLIDQSKANLDIKIFLVKSLIF